MTSPPRSQPDTESAPSAADFAILREVEVVWLSEQLSRAISNLAYPVGMGRAPHPEQIKSAASVLFERYAKMIEMAHATARPQP